jgi:hypothetical protein
VLLPSAALAAAARLREPWPAGGLPAHRLAL